MTCIPRIAATPGSSKASPLVFCDRFLRLAEEADSAGFRIAAEQLLYLASQVLDGPASPAA